ncbi:MAG TPA: hypothetical protein VMU89_14995 [Thermomicrobiaceae bacterium]|nr:hypothetical protein [Thermomicrobiaceae bacterium]
MTEPSEPVTADALPSPHVTASDATDPEHSFGGVGESRTRFRPSDSTIATRLAPPRFDLRAELAADDRLAAYLAASPRRRAPMATRWRRDLPILARQLMLLEVAVIEWADTVELVCRAVDTPSRADLRRMMAATMPAAMLSASRMAARLIADEATRS